MPQENRRGYIYTRTHICIYTHIYIYVGRVEAWSASDALCGNVKFKGRVLRRISPRLYRVGAAATFAIMRGNVETTMDESIDFHPEWPRVNIHIHAVRWG